MMAFFLALLLSLLPDPLAEQVAGSLTLLEGSLTLIRGTTVYQGVEGIHLKRGDILETSPGSFAQLEFAGGVVALGPATRLYILPASGTSTAHPISLDLIMLNGWLKLETAGAQGLYRFRTPLLAVTTADGTVVVRGNSTACDIFLESGGSTSLSEVNSSGDGGLPTQGKAGQFISRQRGTPVSMAARPSSAFLDSMPRQFRDTLPPRQERFSNMPVAAKAQHPVSFDEIEPWLKAPSTWRRGLAERFSSRLSDSNFREQIEGHLREFPEWDPILHPKKTSDSP